MKLLNNPILQSVITILVGLVFMVSSVLKFLSIDTFEIYVYSLNLFAYDLATLIARIIISVEFLLGSFFLLNFYRHKVKLAILAMLVVFSLFLFVMIFLGNEENCNCFGEFVDLNPLESLFKNLLLIGLTVLTGEKAASSFRYKNVVSVSLAILLIATPIILSPPDFIHNALYARKNPGSLPTSKQLADFVEKNQLDEGKYVLCFFSLKCRYCKLAAGKISTMAERLEVKEQMRYLFHGDESAIEQFWKESHAEPLKYTFIEGRTFMQISGGRVPVILFVEDGKLVAVNGYRGVTEKKVMQFLNDE